MSTFQCKFDCVNPSSHSWDISKWRFYSYWWPDISVVCCCLCTSHICTNSPLFSATYLWKLVYWLWRYKLNEVCDSLNLWFDSLNREFHTDQRVVDKYSSQFSFYKADWCSNESKTSFSNILDNIILNTLLEFNIVVVVSDISTKNNIATSIAHIHSFNSLLKKTIYHTISITLMSSQMHYM